MPPPLLVRPLPGVRRPYAPRIYGTIARYNHSESSQKSTSAKLFADAAAEERLQTSTPPSRVQELAALHASKQRNWDGDETTEEAVLRMLVDKYKPLRTGNIRTADEKLKDETSTPGASSSRGDTERSSGVLLSSLPPIQSPTSFSGKPRQSKGTGNLDDAKARAEGRRAKKLAEGPRRAGSALEKSLDYRLGRTLGEGEGNEEPAPAMPRQVNPVTMKGWASVVEEKIEKARTAGVFNKIEGRGRPIKRHHDEVNPFIPREEFLMNRIIRKQGAAPPWVEIQGELENHIRAFRNIIRQSWVRAATRKILLNLPPPPYPRKLPASITVESISRMRDAEWEKREASYHEVALSDVNAQIRRHNGIAPFAARRGYLMRKFELDRCYEESAEEIMEAVKERLEDPVERTYGPLDESPQQAGTASGDRWTLMEMLRRLVMRLMPAPASTSSTQLGGEPSSSSDGAMKNRPVL